MTSECEEYLYNLHTKGLGDFSDSASEKSVSDDENRPPLYTYEELRPNLVVYDGRRVRNYESDMSDEEQTCAKSPTLDHIMQLAQATADVYSKHGTNENFEDVKQDLDKELFKLKPITPKSSTLCLNQTDNTKIEQIYRKLSRQLTKTFCYICQKQNDQKEFHCHYNSGHHINKVHKWLEDQLSNLKKPVDIKYLFCGACNLPLAGKDKAENHYSSPEHLKSSASFCTVCLRDIPFGSVLRHRQTKGHLKKQGKCSKLKINEENVCASYAGALKKPDCDDEQLVNDTAKKNDDGDEENFVKLSDYLKQIKQVETVESISVKFAKLMEMNNCQFCPDIKKVNRKHLKKAHFDNVVQWLENEIAKLDNPIELSLLFCNVCNLPLSGNNSALEHYDTILHLDTVKTFCKVCCQSFPNTSLLLHNQSNKHLKASKSSADILNISCTTVEEDEKMEQGVIKRPSYATAVKKSERESDTSPKKEVAIIVSDSKPMKEYNRLGTYALRYLSELYCYVCNVSVPTPQHYQSQQHMRTVKNWLEENRNLLELFGIQDIDELVCIGCRIVFHDSQIAEDHYSSEEHTSMLKTFCKKCLVHDNAPLHKKHNQELELENSKKNKETFVAVNNKTPSVLIATNLKILLTPSFCEICNVEITKSNFNHYFDRNHILTIRNWLSYAMQTLQVRVNPRLVYCEPCGLVLCGTAAAPAHYKHPDHLANQVIYCPWCIFKGTSDIMLPHCLSLEHRIQFDKSVNLQNVIGIGQQQRPPLCFSSPFTGTGQSLFCHPLVSKQIRNETAVTNFIQSVSEKTLSTDSEENRLRIQLTREVNRLLELLYCSGEVPLKEAVNYLSVINQKLVERMCN